MNDVEVGELLLLYFGLPQLGILLIIAEACHRGALLVGFMSLQVLLHSWVSPERRIHRCVASGIATRPSLRAARTTALSREPAFTCLHHCRGGRRSCGARSGVVGGDDTGKRAQRPGLWPIQMLTQNVMRQ